MFSPLTKQLVEALRSLPGVGPKSALRMAFYLLGRQGKPKGLMLSTILKEALEKIGFCKQCQIYAEQELCTICANPKRNKNLLCVVESAADVAAIEQTHSYNGLYFVLGGHLSPLDGIGPNEIAIPILLAHLNACETTIELIIATNPTTEGKATAYYIANHINPHKIQCSRIALGIPLGSELEYLDGGTLAHAFHSRVKMLNQSN